jgi:hypothetical protein
VPAPAAPVDEVEPAPDVTQPAAPLPDERPTTGPRLTVAGTLLVLAANYVVQVPLAKRKRRRTRRARATTAADRVLVAWAEATEDMTAAGMPPRPEETAAEFAHRVCRAAGPAGAGLVRLADDSSAAAWSAGGVAPEVAVRAAAEAAGIAAELTTQATRRERLMRALDPRPLLTGAGPSGGTAAPPGDIRAA